MQMGTDVVKAGARWRMIGAMARTDDQRASPAFGLVVAIPAVLAYNVLGRLVRQLSEELDGFAHDLHAYVCAPAEPVQPSARVQQASTQQA